MRLFSVIVFVFVNIFPCHSQEKGETLLNAIVSSNNELGIEIYKKIADPNKNVLFSPLALSTSLSMAYSGAAGMTEAQMRRILNYSNLSQEQVAQGYSELLDSLSTTSSLYSSDLSLSMANSLWFQRSIKLLDPFKEGITKQFKGTIESADFFSPDATRLSVNSWARQKSQGKAKEFIARGEITRDMRFLLLSVSSLRGKWELFFDHLQTKIMPFFPYPSKTITVQTMTRTGEYRFFRNPRYLAIELPYDSKKGKNPSIAMIIVLPILTYGLKDIENSMSLIDFVDLMGAMELKKVTLSLPRFKIDSTLSFNEHVEALGVAEAFSSNANFSKIDGSGTVKIDKILQGASISVDEKGSDALGATSVSWNPKGSVSFPETFNASHPFLFAIIHKKTFAILFMGHVVNP